ncbi:MAG: PKD domain-containing protein [Bacteroidetes bacterium]|nr:MAG: PKD domain-containing protein [Bacteroidota bacterium]
MRKIYSSAAIIMLFLFVFSATSFAQCPDLCFTESTNNGCMPLVVTFSVTSTNGSAFHSVFNFNDGSPSYTVTVPTTTVSHTYNSSGFYSPSINVYNSGGGYLGNSYGPGGNIVVNGVTINMPDSVCPGDAANFCPGGQWNSASWNFGDGNTSTESCTNHSYTTIGTYTVTLNANTTSCGNVVRTKIIKVTPNAFPVANWGSNLNGGPACPNQQINFSTGPASSYSWNFGDGGAANIQQPQHTYTVAGTYTVSLIIQNSCGKKDTSVNTVTVSSTVTFPNQSWFYLSAQSSPTCPNSNVGFDAPNGYVSYEWNFGDGSPLQTTTDNYNNHIYGAALTTYTVSVKITNACNKDTTLYKTVQVISNAPFPNQSWFEIRANSPSCPSTEIHFDVPSGYVNYRWNYGDGSPVINTSDYWSNHVYGAALTTYTVSLMITNGCGNDTTLYTIIQISNNVGFPNDSWFTINGSNPSCINDVTFINAPGGYVNYLWHFGDGDSSVTVRGDASHTYTATGTYSVTVKITNGCGRDTTISGAIVIDNTGSFPNWISIDASPASTCPNDLVSFELNTNNGYSSYLWIFGDGDTLLTNGDQVQHSYTATATFNVSCKITNGCGAVATVYTSVSVSSSSPVSPSLGISVVQSPSCPGDDVYFVPTEGQATYTYRWDFGDGGKDTTVGTGSIHAFSSAGTKTVTVVAINGCGSTKTVSITHTVSTTITPSLADSNGEPIWGYPGGEGGQSQYAGCAGDAIIFYFMGDAANNVWNFGDGNSGTATEHIVVFGGEGEAYPVTIIKYSYAVNGTYSISLTLTNGCGNSTTGTMVISIGGNLLVNGDITTSPPPFTTCAPIDFIGFGGATYAWDFGDGSNLSTTSPTVSHTFASAGVYVVSAVITNGCGNSGTYSKSINVSGVGGPTVVLSASVTPTCIYASNGSATVNVTSGELPYTYLWNDIYAQTTAMATGLSAGTYNVVVTDGFGCPTNLVLQLNDPAPIVLSDAITNAVCGIANGSATVTITSGGTAPYSYLWTNGSTTSTASGLAYGQYVIDVTDALGCSSVLNVSISENGGATVAGNSVTDILCNGLATGGIDISVTGGTPPYIYAWSNGSTVQDPTGLAAGTYSVLVTDGGSCVATYNASVAEPDAVAVSTTVDNPPTCGNFDGSTSASATGGTAPYTYLWDSNTGSQTTQIATGLPAGSYSVVITDANGCSGNSFASLSNSNAPVLSAVITDVSCFGGSNGAINLSVVGGTPSYLYTWNVSPPQTNSQNINNLAAGTYFVSVNDKMGCLSFQLYTVAQPAVLTATVANTGATCGNNDGTATASASGGNASYNYLWNNGQTTQTATGLALGNYSVTVLDGKGCSISSTTSITTTVNPIDICGITVDNTSTKNVIVWEKPVATNIDSFRIYRDIATVYTYVGAVAYQDSSYFMDNTNGVNPNTTSYKYKIKAMDNCGNLSVLSDFHQTIHLQVSVAAPPKSFNLMWSDYTGFPVTQYRILIDSLNNGNWKVRDSVPFGSPKQWSDIYHYPDTVNYMIEIEHPTGCIVSAKNPDPMTNTNLNLSKSNINRIQDSTGTPHVANSKNELLVTLFPNPSSGLFTIAMKELHGGSVLVKVFNMLGEEVNRVAYEGYKNKIVVDMNKQPQGVYYIQVSSSQKTTTRKIIIE